MRLLLCTLWLGLLSPLWGQGQGAAFFDDTSRAEVIIRGDLKPLFKDKGQEDRKYHELSFGVISTTDTTFFPVRIKTRGNFRRNLCKLPPLKLNFKKGDLVGSSLDGLDKVKLVLPCRAGKERYDQLVQMEYLTYRLYNQLTDSSFRVHPLQVHFQDTGGKYDPFVQFGFLIESVDLLTERLGGWEIETEQIHPNATQTKLTTLMSVFEFMVGNTDWSIPGLHNIKLVKTDTFAFPLAIPYDFDFCGLVAAPYAKPNPKLGIKSVHERLYRGLCRPQEEMDWVYARFQARREAIFATLENWPTLDDRYRKQGLRYLEEFYQILDTDRRRKYHFEESCR
jgi:hypothetical protein